MIVNSTTGEVVSEGFNQVVSENDPTWCVACAGRRGSTPCAPLRGGVRLNVAPGAARPPGRCRAARRAHASQHPVLPTPLPCRHGEVHAIRVGCKKVGSPHLSGCVIYTSAQPCPMCHTACLWARLEKIYYGATYEDVKEYGK